MASASVLAMTSASFGGGCPASGNDCCAPGNGTPGCSDVDCCNTVCAADPFCCSFAWDSICAGEAGTQCAICGGGGGGDSCGNSANDCCSPSPAGTPFCSDADCCNTVCGFDPFCCSFAWDSICAGEAAGACAVCGAGGCDTSCPAGGVDEGEACGEDLNGGCNGIPAGASSCCFPNGGIGCDDPACQATVCAADPFCCSFAWDSLCAGEAATMCGDLCAGGGGSFPYGVIASDVPVCGSFWADGSFRDTDWYSFELAVPSTCTLTINANWGAVLGLLDGNCPPTIFVIAAVPGCGGSVSACLPAGKNVAFAATDTFSGNPCGSGLNDYVLTLSKSPDCTPLGCGSSDNDCCFASPTGTPFCSDEACCNQVCAIDPFCCTTAWDSLCAGEAGTQCAICNGGGPKNDECESRLPIGDGTTAYSTLGATTSPPALDASCEKGFGLAFVNDIWFTYVATCTGTATFSTCDQVNYDSRLALYSGDCSALTLVACNDDGPGCGGFTSTMTADVVCGNTYLLRVGGFSGSGSGNITISCDGDCPQNCPADLDGDGDVDAADLAILLGAWGTAGPGDLDGNGTVNAADLAILLGAWGPC